MKRGNIICILFGITLLLSTSCTPQNNKALQFSLLYNDLDIMPFRSDWLILSEYKNRKQVDITVKLGDDSDYERAMYLALSSLDPPDVILKVWPETIAPYVHAGKILPISDYLAYLPHFTRYISEHQLESELEKLYAPDGKLYVLPGFQRDIQTQQWVYRADLFQKVGIEEPKDYEELFSALILIRDHYGQTDLLTGAWGGAHLLAMMGANYHIPAGWNGYRHYDENSERWVFSATTDAYKEMLRFLNRCYEAQLLDKNLFTQSFETYLNTIYSGGGAVTTTWISSGLDAWNRTLHEQAQWKPLRVLSSTIGTKGLPAVNPIRKGVAFSATLEHKPHAIKVMQFVDWATFSEEGRELTTWGVEGISYTKKPDGPYYLTTEGTVDEKLDIMMAKRVYGLDLFFNLVEDVSLTDRRMPEEIREFLLASYKDSETLPHRAAMQLTSGFEHVGMQIEQRINPYVEDMTRRFITGSYVLEDYWPVYQKELVNRGVLVLEQLWNNELDGVFYEHE